jgi:hypothetical protein
MHTRSAPWHDVLGVRRGASRDEILAAYRHVCRSCHPDADGNADLFRLVTMARDELLREVQQSHDSSRSAAESRPDHAPDDAEWDGWDVWEPHERPQASDPRSGHLHTTDTAGVRSKAAMFDCLARIPAPRTRREWFGAFIGWCVLGIGLEDWAGRVPILGTLISLAILAFYPVLIAAAIVQWLRRHQGPR